MKRLILALAAAAALADALTPFLVSAFVAAGVLSLAWNGLSYTAAAELAGRARSGSALGLQQSALAVSSVVTPIGFAAVVAASSWQAGFALAALFPLAGAGVLRRLGD